MMGNKQFDDLSARDRVAQTDDDRAANRDEAAAERDEAAVRADHVAEQRDEAAERTDATTSAGRATEERRRAAQDRFRAAGDRTSARHDREAAEHDRSRAGDDRGAAHDSISQLKGLLYQAEDDDEVMLLLGQAQGMIMAARTVSPLQALLELSARAATDGTALGAAASAIVRDANERREARH